MINHIDTKTKIYYGRYSLSALEEQPLKKVCIVTDQSMVSLGLIDPVVRLLKDRGIEYKVFDRVLPDPSVAIVSQGVNHLIDTKPDTIIAIGGGSVLDTAKAIIYLDLKLKEKILRSDEVCKTSLIAIPTTSGTGSEVTSYSIITDAEGNKIAITDSRMLPDVSILDPFFTKSLPQKVIADSGIDVFTHAIEAYVSRESNPFSQAYAREAFLLVDKYLVKMYEDVKDEEARTYMHLASCLAGLAFENSSLGLNHGMAHSIGGRFHLAHGLCNGILLPYIVAFNSQKGAGDKDVEGRYAEVADLLGLPGASDGDKCKSLVAYINQIRKSIGIPHSLKELNIDANEYAQAIPHLTAATMKDKTTPGNPVPVQEDEVAAIYQIIFG